MTSMITAVAKLVVAATLFGVAARAQSFPPAFTLQADRDATLYESATGNLANGSGGAIFVGLTGQPAKRRALVRFDVAGNIPAGSKILGVGLRAISTQSSTPAPLATTLHRVLADWSEGASVAPGNGGGGGQALLGDATWLHRSYPSTLWSMAGGDFAATPSGALALVQSGLSQSGGYNPGLIADVQSWLDSPATNFGWLIKSDESAPSTATRVESRESLGGGVELTLTFLPPGLARTWGYGCLVNGAGTAGQMGLTLTGSATSGATVGLQYHQCPPLSVGATFYALELGYGPAGIGFPICSGTACCQLYLPPATVIPGSLWTTDALGAAADAFTLPPNVPGFLVACQGAAIDSTPLGFALSAGGVMCTQ